MLTFNLLSTLCIQDTVTRLRLKNLSTAVVLQITWDLWHQTRDVQTFWPGHTKNQPELTLRCKLNQKRFHWEPIFMKSLRNLLSNFGNSVRDIPKSENRDCWESTRCNTTTHNSPNSKRTLTLGHCTRCHWSTSHPFSLAKCGQLFNELSALLMLPETEVLAKFFLTFYGTIYSISTENAFFLYPNNNSSAHTSFIIQYFSTRENYI